MERMQVKNLNLSMKKSGLSSYGLFPQVKEYKYLSVLFMSEGTLLGSLGSESSYGRNKNSTGLMTKLASENFGLNR